jgi:hypothetical protein
MLLLSDLVYVQLRFTPKQTRNYTINALSVMSWNYFKASLFENRATTYL